MNTIRIIRSQEDAEKALEDLVARKFVSELATIRQAAQTMSCGKAGAPGRQQALRAVLVGFACNVAELAS